MGMHGIQGSNDAFALAAYLMAQRLLRTLAIESEGMRKLCAEAVEDAAEDAEANNGPLGMEAAALIRQTLETPPFSQRP